MRSPGGARPAVPGRIAERGEVTAAGLSAERRELGAVRLERRLVAAVVQGAPDVLEPGELGARNRPGRRSPAGRTPTPPSGLRYASKKFPETITQAVGSPFSKFSSLYGEKKFLKRMLRVADCRSRTGRRRRRSSAASESELIVPFHVPLSCVPPIRFVGLAGFTATLWYWSVERPWFRRRDLGRARPTGARCTWSSTARGSGCSWPTRWSACRSSGRRRRPSPRRRAADLPDRPPGHAGRGGSRSSDSPVSRVWSVQVRAGVLRQQNSAAVVDAVAEQVVVEGTADVDDVGVPGRRDDQVVVPALGLAVVVRRVGAARCGERDEPWIGRPVGQLGRRLGVDRVGAVDARVRVRRELTVGLGAAVSDVDPGVAVRPSC